MSMPPQPPSRPGPVPTCRRALWTAFAVCAALASVRADLRGDFDPKVLAPSNEYVTPHIPWLKPRHGGPIKVLFIMSQHCMREVVELAQRADLDYQVVALPSRAQPDAFKTPPLTREDFRADLEAKLAAPNDVIVVGVVSWEHLTLWQRYRILKTVKEGTPLVGMAKSADEYLERAAGKQHMPPVLSGLIPFKGLPAFAEHADTAAFVRETLTASRFGKSTITLIRPWGAIPPQAFTPARPEGLALNMVEYDYYLAFVIHLIRAAAGVRPAVCIDGAAHIKADRESLPDLEFVLRASAPRKVTCRFVLRSRANQVLRSDERAAEVTAGDHRVRFAPGNLPAGDYFADLWVEQDGAVIDFGTCFLEVTSETAIETCVVPSAFRKETPVSGSVALTLASAPAGLTLRVRQRDNLDRVTARVDVPVGGPEVAFTLPPTEPLSIVQHIDIELRRGATVLDRHTVPASISNLVPADEFRYVIWGVGQSSALAYLSYHAYRAQWDAGFDTQYTGFNHLVPLSNMHHIPYATRLHPNEADGKRARGRATHVRTPCLTEPTYRRKLAERLTDRARQVAPFSSCEFSMGDECHFRYANLNELCFSPTCTARFRKFLRNEYGAIRAVNAEYGTDYASFDAIEPVTLAEAQEDAKLVPLWVDFRRHMESTWAETQAFCRDTIQAIIPEARVGYEGTDYDSINSFDAFEFEKTMRIMRLNNTYDGVFSPYAVVDLAEPGTMIGTGWIGSYADYKMYRDWNSQAFNRYISWRHLFRGANCVWVWYSCIADNGVGHGSIMAPDFSFFECFTPNFAEMRAIKDGPGKLLMCARREDDGTAILYSASSVHAATASRQGGLSQDVLRSLVPLFEDTHRQFRIISYRQLAEGVLQTGGFRCLVLPFAQALSKAEAGAIREFVANGGTVVADLRPGVCDEHGKPYDGKGVLDDVFGVIQDTALRALKQFKPMVDLPAFPADFPKTYADDRLKLAGGKALGKVGDAPALVLNAHGRGRAFLWNVSLHAYQRNQGVLSIEVERLLDDAPQIKAAFMALAELAELTPPFRVSPDIYGLRAYRFRAGRQRYLGLLQHPCKAKQAAAVASGDADWKTVPPPDPVRADVALDAPYHVYDVRRGRYLGRKSLIGTSIQGGRAELFSLLPYQVTSVDATVRSTVKQGRRLEFEARLSTAGGTPGRHVLRACLVAPDGSRPRHYAAHVIAENGRARGSFPLALNEAAGNWQLVVRDVASGVQHIESIQIAEGR